MANSTSLRFGRNAWGRLYLIDGDGNRHEEVAVVPLFPITEPQRWISIVSKANKEIILIEDPATHAPEVQAILRDELTYRDFVPRIARVFSVSGTSEPCEWHVDTNHGATRFVLKSEEDIRRLSPHEVMIIDANGGRYRVDDTRRLDSRSRRFIEWYV